MKKCKPKKSLIYIRILILLTIILFLNNNSLSYASIYKVYNNNISKTIESGVIEDIQDELYLNELLTPVSNFTGDLTAYTGDCPKCTGKLGCNHKVNVLETGIYYEDVEYGTVRIVASSKKYPCGSIIKFEINKLSNEQIIAIVMDRGVSGNSIDLLTDDRNFAINNIGRIRNQYFEVLRLGWK